MQATGLFYTLKNSNMFDFLTYREGKILFNCFRDILDHDNKDKILLYFVICFMQKKIIDVQI
jgi:hypothetical protein